MAPPVHKPTTNPSITTTDQTALRKVLRRERRVEFAWENLRYFDLLRWHQFENAFGHNMYGFTRTANRAKEYFAAGNWLWPETPTFDKDGFPSFERMAARKPISSSMVNVSMMRRFIYGHCQVMMY